MRYDYITIHVDWSSAESIRAAEKEKARLENEGWEFDAERSTSALSRASMCYRKSRERGDSHEIK